MNAPDYCPKCGVLTDEINISFNVSYRMEQGNSIRYTGDTEYGDDGMPKIGTVCPSCYQEWLDTSLLLKAVPLAGDPYVLVDDGLVQNNPMVEVFDLDVLDADILNVADEEWSAEVADLAARLVKAGLTHYADKCYEELAIAGYGTCDTCDAPYEVFNREGRCGDCGNCSAHCEHTKED